jgi:DNA-binding response OmpR family regulator
MIGLRILVVEDDAMIGMALAEMLEGLGHEVCPIAATEDDAVSTAARFGPDMMIVDARLRDGNGVSAVERICRVNFIPHVFVSGDIARVKALRPGAIVVEKPFDEAGLVRGMQRALDAEPTS